MRALVRKRCPAKRTSEAWHVRQVVVWLGPAPAHDRIGGKRHDDRVNDCRFIRGRGGVDLHSTFSTFPLSKSSSVSGNTSSLGLCSTSPAGGSNPSASAISSIFGRSCRSFKPKRMRNSLVVEYRNGRATTFLRPTILIR